MSEPLIIDQTMLDAASDAARESPRGRRNRNRGKGGGGGGIDPLRTSYGRIK